MVLVSILGMSIVPGTLLYFLPLTARLVFAYIFSFLSALMLFPVAQFITGSVVTQISICLYNRKHKPEERFRSEAKQIAKKMGMDYDKPVYVTDNPRVKSPFVNPLTRKIMLPSSWEKKFHRTEIIASLGHEFGHIKGLRAYAKEVFAAMIATMAFTFVLGLFTIPVILVMAEFAFLMLISSYIMRRNEDRADFLGANATAPEWLYICVSAAEKRIQERRGFNHSSSSICKNQSTDASFG